MLKINDLISPEYQEQNKLLHEQTIAAGKRWGDSGWTHITTVLEFAHELGAIRILDYGCGQGTLSHEIDKVAGNKKVYEYDPAIPGKEAVPIVAVDLVVCTDVMEHVEEDKVEAVIGHIYLLAKSGAYFLISCAPAKAILPDGRNAHVTIKPSEWWVDQMRKFPWTIEKVDGNNKRVRIWIKAHG